MSRTKKRTSKKPESIRSRQARRASPGPETGTGGTISTGPSEKVEIDTTVLQARSNSGISKKKNGKQLSRQQRLRKEKGVARADAVLDQLEKKVDRSKEKSRVIQKRSAKWEDLNSTLLLESKNKSTVDDTPKQKIQTTPEIATDSIMANTDSSSSAVKGRDTKVEDKFAAAVASPKVDTDITDGIE